MIYDVGYPNCFLIHRHPSFRIIRAVIDSEQIGSLFMEAETFSVYLSQFAILEAYRGRGIGSKMLEIASDETKKMGRDRLTLLCREERIPFYKRNGFVVIRKHEYHVSMEKLLLEFDQNVRTPSVKDRTRILC
jgi:ribosomal protein S18 acetylase RimI-like enzyme